MIIRTRLPSRWNPWRRGILLRFPDAHEAYDVLI
jgi:hypothetical protein